MCIYNALIDALGACKVHLLFINIKMILLCRIHRNYTPNDTIKWRLGVT